MVIILPVTDRQAHNESIFFFFFFFIFFFFLFKVSVTDADVRTSRQTDRRGAGWLGWLAACPSRIANQCVVQDLE